VGQHRSASASRLLGLDGLRSSPPVVAGVEWRLVVQTTATAVDFRAEGRGPSSTAGARSGCATCPVAAVRWCWLAQADLALS
jgi:hypothetical protein